MSPIRNTQALGEQIAEDLAAVGAALGEVEARIAEATRRVAEADGRLDRELERVLSEVGTAIQELRDDVAAAVADVRAGVERELMMVPLIPDLRQELLGRIEALEAEVRGARDAD